MGLIVRRFLFGCLWFVIFWFAFGAIGGALAGATASAKRTQEGSPVRGFDQGYQVGYAAGREFHQRHGGQVLVAALVCGFLGSMAGILPGSKGDS